jgi:hypothetical protein
MKLREVIRAVSGFKYEVFEYDAIPGMMPKRRTVELTTSQTEIRCLQHGMHHEHLVNGRWYILSKDQFESILEESKPRRVITRKASGEVVQKPKPVPKLYDRLVFTTHVKQRLFERFGIREDHVKDFVIDVLNTHKMVQNAECYNLARSFDHKPTDLYICSLKHKIIMTGVLKKGQFVLTTCYSSQETLWFEAWFQEHLDTYSNLPELQDFFLSAG